MKLLHLDIETTPHLTYTWGLFDQNIGITQIEKPGGLFCFAASWEGSRETMFFRGDGMVQAAHDLLSEADALCTYNGDRFDIPHLNREFLHAGLKPPAPYASIDLLKTMRKRFKHASNKLDWVSQQLGVGGKTKHPGFQLWLDCMDDDPKAWKTMERYNRNDVVIMKKCYRKALPWIQPHPSVPMLDGFREGCPNCGSMKAERRGFTYTASSKFQRFQCLNCGKWYRGATRLDTTSARALA